MGKIVKPRNTLKEKVGDGGFNLDDIERAQSAIEENDVDFAPIAAQYLEQINNALQKYETSQDSKKLYAELLDSLMQLRAQGAFFHYPSITVTTDIVVDLLDSLDNVDNTIIEIVQAYERSANSLLLAKIKSDNHHVAIALSKELMGVCQRYKDKN